MSRSTRRRSRRGSPASTPSATSRPGAPKAGVFAEGAARAVAAVADRGLREASDPSAYDGRGSCYIEFGGGRIGRVDMDFLSGPKPTGVFQEPSRRSRREGALRREPQGPLVRRRVARHRRFTLCV